DRRLALEQPARDRDVGHDDGAGDLRALAALEALLRGAEGDRAAGVDGAAEDLAGVAVEAARDVDGEDRGAARVEERDQRRVGLADRAREAGPEERVDEERRPVYRARHLLA